MTTQQTQQNTLKSFRLETYDGGENYKAHIDFKGWNHEVKIELNSNLAQKILSLCMDDIVRAIQDTTANALESMRVAASNLIEEAKIVDEPALPPQPPALDDPDEIPF